MVNTKPAAVVSGKDPKPQTALFNKARNDLFKRGNDVHAMLKMKVRVSLWYNGEMYEYASAADVCSSALGKTNSWKPEDFVPISRAASIRPRDEDEVSANDTELYYIASQVRGIIKQSNPGDTGSVRKTTTGSTLVDPAKQPPIFDLTTPDLETSSKRAISGTPSPHRQLRCRRLGPATTDFNLEEEPKKPNSLQRRIDKHFGPSLAARSSTSSGGAMRRTSNRHWRRYTTY